MISCKPLLAGTALAVAAAWHGGCRKAPSPAAVPIAETSGRLEQSAYIWQREWTDPLRQSITGHAGEFAGLTVLGAQLEWDGTARILRPAVDWKLLAGTGRPTGAAIRVQRAAPEAETGAMGQAIVSEARRLVEAAAAAGLRLTEIQIDYDCPQKRLAAYEVWLKRVRRELHPLPLRITTLASWLGEPAFVPLIAGGGGYILQVHSFEVPVPGQPATVCDPAKVRAWVAQAARLGEPFTVALATYRTTAGYDPAGKLLGVATDAAAPAWPAGTRKVEFPANPGAMAALVKEWTKHRPALLRGLYWYRMPVSSDVRNWRWPTLSAVMAGRMPVSRLEVKWTGGQPLDVFLSNTGEQDEWLPDKIWISWPGSTSALGDGVAGWTFAAQEGQAIFTPPFPASRRLLPVGQTLALGWIRFYEPVPPLSSLQPDFDPVRDGAGSSGSAAPRDR